MDTFLTAFAAWLSFLSLQGAAPETYLNLPATDTQIASAEKIIGQRFTADLASLYRQANGEQETISLSDPSPAKYFANLFGGYRFLSIEEAVRSWRGWKSICADSPPCDGYDEFITVRRGHAVRPTYFHSGWLPIAEDGGGNAWAIDLDPPKGGKRGQIVQMGPDEDERRIIASSLTELFAGAAKYIETDNIHVSECCGPRLYFNMDWKEPPALSPAQYREQARRYIRKPRINLQIKALTNWLKTQTDIDQNSSGSAMAGHLALHQLVDRDGAYRLCASEHEAIVALAIFGAQLRAASSSSGKQEPQATGNSFALVHRWLLEAGLIDASRFARVEAMRINKDGIFDTFVKRNVVTTYESGYSAEYSAPCTASETIALLVTWPFKRIRGFLYEWREKREADASLN